MTLTGTNTDNNTIAGILANPTTGGGSLALTKSGVGTWVLGGANTYTGATAIRAGTLALSGGNDRLPTGTTVTLGDGTTSGILRLDSRSQQLAGLLTAGTGTANRVVNGNASAATLTLNIAGGNSFGGVLGGPGGNENNFAVTKTGAGTLTLTGLANTYTGTTTVNAGILALGLNSTISNTLILGNPTPGSATLDVAAKSAFTQQNISGNGAINIGVGDTVSITGAFAPGFSPGIVTTDGNLSFANSTSTTMEIAGANDVGGVDQDYVSAAGTLTFAGLLAIVSFGSYDLTAINETYNLFDGGTLAGTFNSVSVNGNSLILTGDLWSGTFSGTVYQFNELDGVLSVVPEPASMILGGLGIIVLLRRRRN